MGKLKFNLKLDGNPVKNIEDLRDNFNVFDILEEFKQGKLERWLKDREEIEYLNQVQSISKDLEDKEIALKLLDIFEIEDLNDSLDVIFFNKKLEEPMIQVKDFEEYISLFKELKDNLISEQDHNNILLTIKKLEEFISLFELIANSYLITLYNKNKVSSVYLYGNKNFRGYFDRNEHLEAKILKDLFSNNFINKNKIKIEYIEDFEKIKNKKIKNKEQKNKNNKNDNNENDNNENDGIGSLYAGGFLVGGFF